MTTSYRLLTFGLLSSLLLFNAGFANIANQPLLPITELFTNASYEKLLTRYRFSSTEIEQFLTNENIMRTLSYLKTLNTNDEEFFNIIDILDNYYPLKQRPEHSKEIMNVIEEAFKGISPNPTANQPSQSADQFDLITNNSSPRLHEWIPLLILAHPSYRGRVNFSVEWRETTNSQRTPVSSSAYFTADKALEDGIQFTTRDNGQIVFADFIKFEKS
jgi:hypothetical protein